jgi:L-aspartate oxidase
MGGVLVDADGRTSRDGLWAAGEVACTGVHGANRLASNSLLEALVYGARVARSVSGTLAGGDEATLGEVPEAPVPMAVSSDLDSAQERIRRLMWDEAGLVRTADGLRRALERLEAIAHELPEGLSEVGNLATVARLVARAALARSESRGAHYRADCPDTRTAWRRRLVLSLSGRGEQLAFEPIPETRAPQEVSA